MNSFGSQKPIGQTENGLLSNRVAILDAGAQYGKVKMPSYIDLRIQRLNDSNAVFSNYSVLKYLFHCSLHSQFRSSIGKFVNWMCSRNCCHWIRLPSRSRRVVIAASLYPAVRTVFTKKMHQPMIVTFSQLEFLFWVNTKPIRLCRVWKLTNQYITM